MPKAFPEAFRRDVVRGNDIVSVGSKKDALTGEVELVAMAKASEDFVLKTKAADGTVVEKPIKAGEQYPASPTKDVNSGPCVRIPWRAARLPRGGQRRVRWRVPPSRGSGPSGYGRRQAT